jgi:hypothetical protein
VRDAIRFEVNHQARALVNAAIALERRSNDEGASIEALASLSDEISRATQRIDDYLCEAQDEEDAPIHAALDAAEAERKRTP